MADINANLIKARDGASPQHKVKGANRFEATEGSDGAQHVKLVGGDGELIDKLPVEFKGTQTVEVSNSPSDYPDSAVKAELESIKQTQQAILDRLDSPIDTQVTGSNVEDGLLVKRTRNVTDYVETHNAVILPPSSFSHGLYFDCDGFDKVVVNLRNDSNADSLVTLYWAMNGVNFTSSESVLTGTSDRKVDEFSIKARYLRVTLHNRDSESSHTMTASAYLKV